MQPTRISLTLALVSLLVFCLWVSPVRAEVVETATEVSTEVEPVPEPERHLRDKLDLGFGLGLGMLDFFFLDIHYAHNPNWLFGLAVGGLPVDSMLSGMMGLDDLSVGAEEESIAVRGEVETGLGAVGLYSQWFPWEGVFYLRGTLAVWNLSASAQGNLVVDGAEDEALDIRATANVAVPMLGFGVGWRFQADFGLFFDLSLGYRLFLSPGAEVEFSGSTVDQLASDPEVAQLLEDAQTFLSERLEDGANRITSDITGFPNITLRLGWTFNFFGRD